MDDATFRIVVTVAGALACVAFLVQAGVAIALLKVAKGLQTKVNETTAKVAPILDNGRQLIVENRPRINEVTQNIAHIVADSRPRVAEVGQNAARISKDAAEMTRSVRDQVSRVTDVVRDGSARTKARMAQLDESIDSGIEKAEQAGDAARAAAMKPVVQAQGILAGVRAAVAAYSNSGRRSAIETATQDEEMFI